MNRFTRGSHVPIETIFYNSTGGIVYPTSATLTIAYPPASTSSDWPFDGTDLATTTISLTTPTTASTDANVGKWRTTWDSAISGAGRVYWTAVPSSDVFYSVNEGMFDLRGGLANLTAVPSTL